MKNRWAKYLLDIVIEESFPRARTRPFPELLYYIPPRPKSSKSLFHNPSNAT